MKRMGLLLAAFAVLSCGSWSVAQEVVSSYVMADSEAVEEAVGGTLFAHLAAGDRALSASELTVGGRAVSEWRAERQIAWWRLRPEPIAPGSHGMLTIRFQQLPEGDTIELGLGDAELEASLAPPAMRFAAMAVDQGRSRVTAHVEREQRSREGIAAVLVDGRPASEGARVIGFAAGVCPIVINLDPPWQAGTYHVISVATSAGSVVSAEVRARDDFFEIGTFGNHLFEDYASHAINVYQSFGYLPAEKLAAAGQQGLRVTMPAFRARRAYFLDGLPTAEEEKRIAQVAGCPALLAWYLEDEPDCFDWSYAGTFDHWVELGFANEVRVASVELEEVGERILVCELQVPEGEDWRTVAEVRPEPSGEKGVESRQVPLASPEPVAVTALRIYIPRCTRFAAIRELRVFDDQGADRIAEAKIAVSSRWDRLYGRDTRGPEKMRDGDPKTYWQAGHSRRSWVGETGLEMVRRAEMCARLDPVTAMMCLVDNTYRPGNYFTYAHVADIFDTDPYVSPAMEREVNFSFVAWATSLCRAAAAPRPVWITLWMGWGANHCRAFTEPEERIMAFYALGAGARGINYYLHSGGSRSIWDGIRATGRREEGLALWEGVGRLNRQLARAGPWLARSCPVDLVRTAPEGVSASTLLVADEAIVLVAVNTLSVGKGEEFEAKPIADARATLALPPFLPATRAQLVSPEGLTELPAEVEGGRMTIALPEFADGLLIVLNP